MIPAPLFSAPNTTPDGWVASLELEFSRAGTRTVLEHNRHRGPLRVQRPLYPEGDLAHVYILHPPGGVVGGDRLNISLDVASGAQVLCTTPGSGKFYLSAGPNARVEQRLQVAAGASLEWLPQENILFSGARVQASTEIALDDDAVFIGWDITCLGRPVNREHFEHGAFSAHLAFHHNRELLLVEHQRVFDKQTLNAAAGLRGQPLQGILLAFPCTAGHLERVRDTLAPLSTALLAGATLVGRLLIIRALHQDSETLKQAMILAWKALRPELLERPAIAPRIWAT